MAEEIARREAQAAREHADRTSDVSTRAEWLMAAQLWEEIANEYAQYSMPSHGSGAANRMQ
jgi:hypothetical protein